jgi:hypothetical protein
VLCVAKVEFGVEEYSLSQSSLEQVHYWSVNLSLE